MKKWIALLTFALLFNAACSRAETAVFYTNNEDRYYHADADCDRPMPTRWWDGAPQAYYERSIYQKYEISENAAAEFEKTPCPVCVKEFEPVYLGDHMPEWDYDAPAWEISGLTPEQENAFRASRPREFIDEISATSAAFDDYYAEVYKSETGLHERRHAYPAVYAGRYSNNAGCMSIAVVDPGAEILAAFEDMFGGGAWIVPAKYGYDEIVRDCDRVVQELRAWCEVHPDVDARFATAGSPDYENYAVIGIDGADWELAAAAMEETAPIYIHFIHEEQPVPLDS